MKSSNFSLEHFSEAINFLASEISEIKKMILEKESPKETKFIGRKELCELLHISVPSVIKLEREGVIKNLRTGSRAHYEVEEVKKALAAQELRPKVSKSKVK